jgi:hypothetical protein
MPSLFELYLSHLQIFFGENKEKNSAAEGSRAQKGNEETTYRWAA